MLNAAWDEENERETGMSRQILCIKNLKKPGDDAIEESCLLQKTTAMGTIEHSYNYTI